MGKSTISRNAIKSLFHFPSKATAIIESPLNSGGSSRNGGGSGEDGEKHLLTHCCKYLINSSSRRNR